MMKCAMNVSLKILSGMLLLLQVTTVSAEDIDLFTGNNPASSEVPTILLGWHNAGSSNSSVTHGCTYNDDGAAPAFGNTVMGMEQCALVNAVHSLLDPANAGLLGAINLGLMVYNENNMDSNFPNGTSLGNGNNGCGYMLVKPELMDATGVANFKTFLKAFDETSNSTSLGDLMAESWAMLNGLSTSCSGVNYSSLASVADACSDAVLIFIGNATKQTASVRDSNGNPDDLLKAELSNAFGYTTNSGQYQGYATPRAVTQLNNADADNNPFWGDEWSRFMNSVDVSDSVQSDRNVRTYSIAVYEPSLADALAGEINFLTDLATVGGGESYKVTASNSAGLGDILIRIFNEVQSVDSVFSSAALPVSVNTQGTYLNQIYLALFRPDVAAGPRWYGSVKQYQVGLDSGGNLVLADATESDLSNATDATNSVTGSLDRTATSFWSTNTPKELDGSDVADWPAGGFWVNSPDGDAFGDDAPDGSLVEKGGVGQMLRIDNLTSSSGRTVYTCNATGLCPTGSTLPSFATSNSTLVANISSILSGVSAGGSTTFSVGALSSSEAMTAVCDGSGKKADRRCTVTHDGSMNISVDELLIISGTDCTTPSPCTVTAATATTFELIKNESGELASPFNSNVVQLSDQAAMTQVAHGLMAGETISLDGCAVSLVTGNEYNTGAITGDGVLAQVVASTGANTFTATMSGGEAYAASIVCGTSVGTLTADNLINWMRGDDLAGNEAKRGPCPPGVYDPVSCPVLVRGSIHGDVLHSRPAVVNYGATGVVVFYGSNDGHFRAVNGNQTDAISGVRPGGELWSFVAPEFFDRLERQFNNSPVVNYPGVVDINAESRDYFFDGTTTVLQDSRTGQTAKTYIYLSARRGGGFIYAMDVTDPVAPKYLWKISSTNIPELEQSWSEPQVALIQGHSNPVLIFGAGYDPAEDAEPTSGINTKGRGIIIADAITGGIVWAALPSCVGVTVVSGGHCLTSVGLTRAIPADIALVDRDFDGLVDRLYAADIGANIWRVDLEPTADPTAATPSDFTLNKLAALGGSGNNARKILYSPDVVITAGFDAVVAVTGDRTHPLYTADTTAGLAYNVQNRFYMITDTSTGKSVGGSFATMGVGDLVDQSTLQCVDASQNVVPCTTPDSTALIFDGSFSGKKGYYLDLDTGEKGVNAPLVITGKVYFGTNQPDIPGGSACAATLGNAYGYEVDILTGSNSRHEFSGGGLPPSPITGLVDVDGTARPFCIGCSGDSVIGVEDVRLPPGNARKRTYWFYK